MSITFVGDFKLDEPSEGHTPDPDTRLVANFECAIDTEGNAGAVKAYPVIYAPGSLKVLDKFGFAALNIANNHVYDAGQPSLDYLTASLRKHRGISVYGLRDDPYAVLTCSGLRVAVIGSLESCRSRGPSLLPECDVEPLIRKISPSVDRVFVTPHWGKEGEYALHPSPRQRSLARRWIQAGAHGVIGHHTHTVQASESIDGRPVFYSLGNFLFNHEEGAKHLLTRIGASVKWEPGEEPSDDSWTVTPFHVHGGRFDRLCSNREESWRRLFDKLAEDITSTARPWSNIRWARAVGPTYMNKSRLSWKRRFTGRNSLRNRLVWMIWTLMPTTMLLRFGACFPERRAQRLIEDFETIIQGIQSD